MDRRIDARGKVVLPGLVNTHHHLPQVLTRNVAAVQQAPLFRWLTALYPIWSGLDGAAVGVAGYITRNASMMDALDAIGAAARGEVHCSPRVAGFLFRHIASLARDGQTSAAAPVMTTRESQILDLLCAGMTNKMISRRLGIELPTVKNHVHSILAKLGVHRRAEAMLLFRDKRPGGG